MVHQMLHRPGLEITTAPALRCQLAAYGIRRRSTNAAVVETTVSGRNRNDANCASFSLVVDRFWNGRMKSAIHSDDGADGGGGDLLAGLRNFQLGGPPDAAL